MHRIQLGKTNLKIHPLVFGTLPLGPLQANLSAQAGGRLIRHALEQGVNLIDTAELYGSYAHIRAGLDGYRGEALIATKTHAADASTARRHVEKALRELGREHLDIVHLHAARVANPFVDRAAVLDELLTLRAQGLIGEVGLSTHYVRVVREAADHPEVSVLHPLINRAGRGLLDGTAAAMADAIAAAGRAGKGVYAMKALAGGNLISSARQALGYVRDLPGVDALALGMLSEAEIAANLSFMQRDPLDETVWEALEQRRRRLQIMTDFCSGCGACAASCSEGGLQLVDGKAVVDTATCVLCGYCAAACPDFIIRVV